jgi:hypothetical protein
MTGVQANAQTEPTVVSAPQVDSNAPCHGYVYQFNKVDGKVHANYWIYCNKTVDKIVLKAFLREGDRWSAMNTVTCYNTWVCQNHEYLADRSGTQWYYPRAYEGYWPPETYVTHNGRTWRCNASDGMRCNGDGKQF